MHSSPFHRAHSPLVLWFFFSSMDEYEKLHRIGSGGQGKILRLRHKGRDQQYACKMILWPCYISPINFRFVFFHWIYFIYFPADFPLLLSLLPNLFGTPYLFFPHFWPWWFSRGWRWGHIKGYSIIFPLTRAWRINGLIELSFARPIFTNRWFWVNYSSDFLFLINTPISQSSDVFFSCFWFARVGCSTNCFCSPEVTPLSLPSSFG